MRIGFLGAGHIGGNAARLLAGAGHEVVLSARDAVRLEPLAAAMGASASVGSPTEAAACDVVVLSVPWGAIDEVLAGAGPLDGRIVLDTTNHYGPGGLIELPADRTAAQVNAARMPGARYTKSLNTLTARFQADAAGRTGGDRVAMFLVGDDEEAKGVVGALLDDAGFAPVDIGGVADASVMEAPRRPGSVYGEEYSAADGQAVAEALRAGRPLPRPSVAG